MAKEGFQNAPSAARDFSQAHDEQQREQRPDGTPDPVELLDDHDLSSWDLTPGGTIEQSVHTRLSEAGRSAYREATRPPEERDYDELYARQLDNAFERAAANDDVAHEFTEQSDERRAEAIRSKDHQVRERIAAQKLDEAAKKAREGRPMTGAELAEAFANEVNNANRRMTDNDYGIAEKQSSPTDNGLYPWSESDPTHRDSDGRVPSEFDVLGPSFEKAHGRESPEIER
ncbi:hypothetical protein [Botrimarina mediterranea]|uniref:Uncharacterized protein n=1 Tax=Botrimarina mediterranea TaxID=2528022 RepID=A0A518K224_9BACT|nr:hypothetical protein [Botrimarina mediterranea]QDV71868.1 hypothetical protein Spa11_00370 [Botrimarina mediterranea]